MFDDAGYNEGSRRQHTGDTMTEMLMLIRRFLMDHVSKAGIQTAFLGSRAQAIVDVVDKICTEIKIVIVAETAAAD